MQKIIAKIQKYNYYPLLSRRLPFDEIVVLKVIDTLSHQATQLPIGKIFEIKEVFINAMNYEFI